MLFTLFFLFLHVNAIKLPGSCLLGEYYEPSLMQCLTCPANVSMTTSIDGFSCTCQTHSIPSNVARCRQCSVKDMLSDDGTFCVPRRCQTSAGRVSCRKCPLDYITVTQNHDGSPMKEAQCVKCTRGYKPQDNKCVRCESCVCNKTELIVAGRCIPKKFLLDRPKYTENREHPNLLLEFVKFEYLCTEGDILACRALANSCVRNFYSSESAGPCRLWFKPNSVPFKGFPALAFHVTKDTEEIKLNRGQVSLDLNMMEYTSSGGLRILDKATEVAQRCLPPITIKIGVDYTCNTVRNIVDIDAKELNNAYELYISKEHELKQLPIKLVKPDGHYVQKDLWPSDKFRKYFVVDKFLSITTNTSHVVYLRTLVFHIRIERDSTKVGSLKIVVNIEGHYGTMPPLSDSFTTTLRVVHDMPPAGVLRIFEISGGLFGSAMALYCIIKWRGSVRRGAPQYVLLPIIVGALADVLYFAILVSTLHALAAEAGTLGLTLPLSKTEEKLIRSIVYAVVCLKAFKTVCVNACQCRCSILLIDWSKHDLCSNIPENDVSNNWKERMVIKEWAEMQTRRQVSPGFTVSLTLLAMHLTNSWQAHLPTSQGYKWSTASVAWWSSYCTMFVAGIIKHKLFGPPTRHLPRVCSGVGTSLVVFQDERYGHYVNGRIDDTLDSKLMSGTVSSCRLLFSSQLRSTYQKLSNSGYGDVKPLLTRFMSAYFERALDGLNWVACERTVLEKLLDVELVDREGGTTSVLLYDADGTTPSCFTATWWGEEWVLATFDAMLFGSVSLSTGQPLYAALVTVVVWQIMKQTRDYFGSRNFKDYMDSTTHAERFRF